MPRWVAFHASPRSTGRSGRSSSSLGALTLFALQSLAVGLVLGRDAEDYVIHGWELFPHEPLFPKLMLARTPVSGLVIDGLYAVGGAVGLEIGLGLLFAGAVTGWVAVARQWGRKPAIAMFVLLAVVPAYGLFFHRVSSDPVFAAILALVAYTAVRMGRRPTVLGALALGVSDRPPDPHEAVWSAVSPSRAHSRSACRFPGGSASV